jgi:hypothetical protein
VPIAITAPSPVAPGDGVAYTALDEEPGDVA